VEVVYVAKYGTFKYGTEKYGVLAKVGEGTISPQKILDFITIYLVSVGTGIVSIAKSFGRFAYKPLEASMSIIGAIKKHASKLSGIGILPIVGKTQKKGFKKVGSGIMSILQSLAKRTFALVGQGIVTASSLVSRMKFFFFVTLDNILQPLGLHVLKDSKVDLFPQVKAEKEHVPGKDGDYVFTSNIMSRIAELHVASEDGLTPEELDELYRLCERYLDPRVGNRNLVFEENLNKQYRVRYSGYITPKRYASWVDFVIPLKMCDPYIYSKDEKLHSGSGTLTNGGNEKAPIIIQIGGEITDPEITVGEYTLSYSGTIPSGQELIINTQDMTVRLDGGNALKDYTGGMPWIEPGETAVTADSKVTFRWRDRWI